jgi:hypothetical protein
MIGVPKESGMPVLEGLYQQLLKRGVEYFLRIRGTPASL